LSVISTATHRVFEDEGHPKNFDVIFVLVEVFSTVCCFLMPKSYLQHTQKEVATNMYKKENK
jgi:hypothetical protein